MNAMKDMEVYVTAFQLNVFFTFTLSPNYFQSDKRRDNSFYSILDG